MKYIALTCLGSLWAWPIVAQTRAPLVTDRPDFTESAEAVDRGEVQVEAGITLSRFDGANDWTLGEVLVRMGIVPGAELRLGLNSFAVSDGFGSTQSGLEDFSLGVKVELHQPAEGSDPAVPTVALLLSTSIPTGAEGFGEDALQPQAIFSTSWEVSDRASLGTNLNLGYPSVAGDGYAQFSGSVALGVSLAERLGGYAEYFVFAPPAPDQSAAGFLNGGLTVLITSDFQLDGRVGVGVHGHDADVFVGFGAAKRF